MGENWIMSYLKCLDIARQFTEEERTLYLRVGTAVRPNDVLQKIVSLLKPSVKNIVEIGTASGMSALVLASCSNVEKVVTFDVKRSINTEPLWKRFNVIDKIQYFVKNNSQEIYDEINKHEFDFAYVDGSHEPEFVLSDFNAVKHIGRVLFDDIDGIQIRDLIIDENEGKLVSRRFGYWSVNNDYKVIKEIRKTLDWDEPLNPGGGILKLNFDYLEELCEN